MRDGVNVFTLTWDSCMRLSCSSSSSAAHCRLRCERRLSRRDTQGATPHLVVWRSDFPTLRPDVARSVAQALLSRDESSRTVFSRLARQRVMQHCLLYLGLYIRQRDEPSRRGRRCLRARHLAPVGTACSSAYLQSATPTSAPLCNRAPVTTRRLHPRHRRAHRRPPRLRLSRLVADPPRTRKTADIPTWTCRISAPPRCRSLINRVPQRAIEDNLRRRW